MSTEHLGIDETPAETTGECETESQSSGRNGSADNGRDVAEELALKPPELKRVAVVKANCEFVGPIVPMPYEWDE